MNNPLPRNKTRSAFRLLVLHHPLTPTRLCAYTQVLMNPPTVTSPVIQKSSMNMPGETCTLRLGTRRVVYESTLDQHASWYAQARLEPIRLLCYGDHLDKKAASAQSLAVTPEVRVNGRIIDGKLALGCELNLDASFTAKPSINHTRDHLPELCITRVLTPDHNRQTHTPGR